MEKDSKYEELAAAVSKLIDAIDNNCTSLWTPMVDQTVDCIVLGETEYKTEGDEDDKIITVEYSGVDEELQVVEELLRDFRFQEIKEEMDFNGYAWKNDEAFITDSDKPCFIPGHAESISDAYNKARLLAICEEFVDKNEIEISAEALLDQMYYSVDWCSPETWLKDYLELLED